jgi:hypothetical protein
MAAINPDVYASASHQNMIGHLNGPFMAGAVDSPVKITAAGRLQIEVSTREPVLIIAPLVALDDRRMQVDVVLDPDGAATKLAALQFDAYTEEGAFLPAHVPTVDPSVRTAAPFTVELSVTYRDRDDKPLQIPVADVATVLQARLIEGMFGKVLYMLGSEKLRLRRQLREVLAMRALSAARWDALDRFGADLAVPRFSDRLTFDETKNEIVAITLEANGQPVDEGDSDYRRRLVLYHSWSMPTRGTALNVLNGPGQPNAPNAGLMAELGMARRFTLEERNNAFAFAVHIVAGQGGAAARTNFFTHLGATRLIWPAEFAANDPHAGRLLSTAQRQALEAERLVLRAGFAWTQAMAVAPALAETLARVSRVRQLLLAAAVTKIVVKRAFDAAAGSRYELGHGIDIAPLAAAELDAMHAKLQAPGFLEGLPAGDAALLRGMNSRPAAEDSLGVWLFEACGLPTVHQLNAGAVYISSLPTFGLVINEAAVQPDADALALEALYQAPGDPATNAALEAGLTEGIAAWTAAGGEALKRVSPADVQARWRANTPQPPAAHNVLLAAGLPAPLNLASLAVSLDRVPAELLAGVELGPTLAHQIIAGDDAAVARLKTLLDILRTHHVSSALALITGPNQVTLVVAAIGLPEAGINLSERRTTGFRWYAAPIEGGGGSITPSGARATWRKQATTLSAIVVIGYARRGLVDPYEYRVDLPAGATLNLTQYEFLMNALERLYPLGVQVNTFAIRREHVKLREAGGPEPLPPAFMRTYRKFQRRHRRGEAGVGLQPEVNQP